MAELATIARPYAEALFKATGTDEAALSELLEKQLDSERSNQLIAGVQYEPREGLRAQASTYYYDRTALITRTRPQTRKPSMYRVLLLNDDYTPMEFVVHVLEKFFHKGRQEATDIMLTVHKKGVGMCGVFTYEVAEAKVMVPAL